MKTTAFLEQQFTNIHALFANIAGDISEEEWRQRPDPGQNRIGFTVWHIPRTQDNFVHGWVQGLPEVLNQPEWSHWAPLRPLGIGVGITGAEADGVAVIATREDVLAYEEAVFHALMQWLRSVGDDDLDAIPDVARHLAPFPQYQTLLYLEETDGLRGQPVWNLLMRPCIGHIHRHLGELELAKSLVRSRTRGG
jgi:hypothetical protein